MYNRDILTAKHSGNSQAKGLVSTVADITSISFNTYIY